MRTTTFLSEPKSVDTSVAPPTVKFANGRRCKCPDAGILSVLVAGIPIGEDSFVEVNSRGEILALTVPKIGRVTDTWRLRGQMLMSFSSGDASVVVPPHFAEAIRTLLKERTVVSFGIDATGTLRAISRRKTKRPPEGDVVVTVLIKAPKLPLIKTGDARRSMAAMNALRCELAEFVDYRKAVCIPFSYADNGCQARAHEMYKRLGRMKIRAGKIWCFSRDPYLFADMIGPPKRLVRWNTHVAPFVVTPSGERVIDPSLSQGLLSPRKWLDLMHAVNPHVVRSSGRYYRITYLPASKTYELSTDPGGVTLWDLRRYLFDQTRLTREMLRKEPK